MTVVMSKEAASSAIMTPPGSPSSRKFQTACMQAITSLEGSVVTFDSACKPQQGKLQTACSLGRKASELCFAGGADMSRLESPGSRTSLTACRQGNLSIRHDAQAYRCRFFHIRCCTQASMTSLDFTAGSHSALHQSDLADTARHSFSLYCPDIIEASTTAGVCPTQCPGLAQCGDHIPSALQGDMLPQSIRPQSLPCRVSVLDSVLQ